MELAERLGCISDGCSMRKEMEQFPIMSNNMLLDRDLWLKLCMEHHLSRVHKFQEAVDTVHGTMDGGLDELAGDIGIMPGFGEDPVDVAEDQRDEGRVDSGIIVRANTGNGGADILTTSLGGEEQKLSNYTSDVVDALRTEVHDQLGSR
ncbi:hypothetical protein NE237_000314 [Protea cynaroides]|uniref:Uncharacterized protein n=1 Tax=Protea cynaroides TaxID=273540 RepID=A0A9Q0QX30_9MAGN|nr:hypothetical protein NE237_000314 [Protea cynaroides]